MKSKGHSSAQMKLCSPPLRSVCKQSKIPPAETLLSNLSELSSGKKKKKTEEKALEILRHLDMYILDISALEPLFNGLQYFEDISVIELSHMLIQRIASSNDVDISPCKSLIQMVMTMELGCANTLRKSYALLTYALIVPHDDVVFCAPLLECVTSIIRGSKSASAPATGKSKKSKGKDAALKASSDAVELLRSALYACRIRFAHTKSLFMPVMKCIGHEDPLVARHAIALVRGFIEHALPDVTSYLQGRIPHVSFSEDRPVLSDALARVHLCHVCHVILTQSENQKPPVVFQEWLYQCILDENPQVCLESASLILKQPWDSIWAARLNDFSSKIPYHVQCDEDTPWVLAMLSRVSSMLNPFTAASTVHAATRFCAYMGKSHAWSVGHHGAATTSTAHGDVPPHHDGMVDLWDAVEEPLYSLVASAPPSIRLRALQACVWLAQPNRCERLVRAVQRELQARVIPSHSLLQLFQSVHTRIAYTPEMSVCALKLCMLWIRFYPAHVRMQAVFSIWKRAFTLCDVGAEIVLDSCYDVLDSGCLLDTREAHAGMRADVYQFLGMHANLLALEPNALAAASSARRASSSSSSSSTAVSLSGKKDRSSSSGKGTSEKKSKKKGRRKKNSSTAPAVATTTWTMMEDVDDGAMADPATPRAKHVATPSNYSIEGTPMGTMVLRLEHGAMCETPFTSNVCIEALAKIALRTCNAFVKMRVYRFLKHVLESNGSQHSIAHPTLTAVVPLLKEALVHIANGDESEASQAMIQKQAMQFCPNLMEATAT